MNIFRRHTKACTKGYSPSNRHGDQCNCMIHVEGKLGTEFIRQSTGTRSMSKARKLVVEAEERGSWEAVMSSKAGIYTQPKTTLDSTGEGSVSYATTQFLADSIDPKGRNLSATTVTKYRTVLRRLAAFLEGQGIFRIDSIGLQHLESWRRTWEGGAQTAVNNIAVLRRFFKYCARHKWIPTNIALEIELPLNYQRCERDPYTPREMELILEAARSNMVDHQNRDEITNEMLETFILLMRYSGMAIMDAARFRHKELRGDEVRYFRWKTRRLTNRKLVVVPIPEWLVARLQALPMRENGYFFPIDTNIKMPTQPWHRRLQSVFEEAGVVNGKSHRFRHTFACELLQAHVSIDLVSRYLGHNSIVTTQKHYSHYLESRIQADSNVLRRLYGTTAHAPVS